MEKGMERADVLVVDDEPRVLGAVRRALAGALDLAVETMTDPREAVELLKAAPPKVLVTDFRMPGLDGIAVCREARRVAPETVRILLTGHTDREHLVEAINGGKIFRYVEKPWDNEALAEVVAEALAAHESNLRRRRAVEENATLRRAVDKAGEVQRSLLPPERLPVAGAEAACSFTACEHATGDYVDALALPSGRNALIVGDVSGHGLGAALFVCTARALLRSGLADGGDLAAVVERTNRFLCRDMSDGRFLTLFVAVHEPARGVLRYVNAGHTPPVLLRAGEPEELGRTGLPLGILDDASYGDTGETAFAAGETLFLCTDGLVEARDAAGELFGTDRLAALLDGCRGLAPGEIVALVRQEALAFAPEAARADDLALLAYRPK